MHSSILDNDDYFQHRQMVADENGVEYKDNDERAAWIDATLIISGWSVSSMIKFMPDRRMTSCNWFLRSLTLPHFGIKVLISLPFS